MTSVEVLPRVWGLVGAGVAVGVVSPSSGSDDLSSVPFRTTIVGMVCTALAIIGSLDAIRSGELPLERDLSRARRRAIPEGDALEGLTLAGAEVTDESGAATESLVVGGRSSTGVSMVGCVPFNRRVAARSWSVMYECGPSTKTDPPVASTDMDDTGSTTDDTAGVEAVEGPRRKGMSAKNVVLDRMISGVLEKASLRVLLNVSPEPRRERRLIGRD